jgi:hypothetical protein
MITMNCLSLWNPVVGFVRGIGNLRWTDGSRLLTADWCLECENPDFEQIIPSYGRAQLAGGRAIVESRRDIPYGNRNLQKFMYSLPTISPWSGQYSGQRVHNFLQISINIRYISPRFKNKPCIKITTRTLNRPAPSIENYKSRIANQVLQIKNCKSIANQLQVKNYHSRNAKSMSDVEGFCSQL